MQPGPEMNLYKITIYVRDETHTDTDLFYIIILMTNKDFYRYSTFRAVVFKGLYCIE